MKLSQFKVSKKVTFVNGVAMIEDNNINGEIEFYNIDRDRAIQIQNEVFPKLGKDKKDDQFAYLVFPFLTNIEVDIELDEFIKMVNSPSLAFSSILEILVETINETFDIVEKNAKIENKINIITEKHPEAFVKEETVEEKIARLDIELGEEKDIKKKRIIFNEISNLYKELGE